MQENKLISKKGPLKPLKKIGKNTDILSLIKKTSKGKFKISSKLLIFMIIALSVQLLPTDESTRSILTHATELYSLGFVVLDCWNGFNKRN